MEKFYRNLFKKSWQITWKNKWLWFFGLFATFLANGTLYETIIRSFTNLSEGRSIFYTLQEYANSGMFSFFSWTKMLEMVKANPAVFTMSLFILLIVLAIFAAMIILAIVSQVGLVQSAVAFSQKKRITFKKAFATGVHKFWPVFGLNFFMRVIMFGILVLLAFLLSFIVVKSAFINNLIFVVSFVVLLILGIIVYFITLYSNAFIVLRDKKVFDAIRMSWYVFKENILVNLEVGLILFVINVLFGLTAFLISLFVVSPFILIYLLLLLMSVNTGLSVLVTLIITLFILVLILIGSWFTAFQVSTWTLLFEELALKKGKSKILRLIHSVTRKAKPTPKKVFRKKKK